MALDANEMFLNGQSISEIEQHLTLLNNHHQAVICGRRFELFDKK